MMIIMDNNNYYTNLLTRCTAFTPIYIIININYYCDDDDNNNNKINNSFLL